MRITCPSCAAEYEVPPERVSPGRSVRCAKCGDRWVPLPLPVPAVVVEPEVERAAPVAPVVAEVAPEVATPVVVEPIVVEPVVGEVGAAVPLTEGRGGMARRRGGGALLAVAWVATLLLLGGAGYAAVVYRQAVVHAWPASARAYGWLRLSV